MTRYLSLEDVLVLHELAIQKFGGSSGLMSRERLNSCLETPQQTMFGQELYPDLWAKASILFYLLVQNHCFVDGNKRTAVLALIEFLERNGYTLKVTNDELYEFTVAVASSQVDKERVTAWVRENVVEMKESDA